MTTQKTGAQEPKQTTKGHRRHERKARLYVRVRVEANVQAHRRSCYQGTVLSLLAANATCKFLFKIMLQIGEAWNVHVPGSLSQLRVGPFVTHRAQPPLPALLEAGK